MSDDDRNLDLRTAEELMRTAQTDEDRAQALMYHANGVRNLIQSGLSAPFAQAVEGIIKREIGTLSRWLENSDRARQDDAHTMNVTLGKIHQESEQTFAAVQEVAHGLGKLEADHQSLVGKVSDLGEILDETNVKAVAADSKAAQALEEVVALKDRVATVEATQQQQGAVLAQQGTALARIDKRVSDIRILLRFTQLYDDEHPPPPEIAAIIEQMDAE